MNNEEYLIELEKIISSLKDLRIKGRTLAQGIIGKTLTIEDLFFCSSLDRCLRLIDGIIFMLKERNLTCAGALLRLQMDNCMRTYAAYIAEDRSNFFKCILDGSKINKQKDIAGNLMTDGYLKKAISYYDRNFERVYNQASGFIHLSEKAFYQTVSEVKEDGIEFYFGYNLPEKRNEPLMECAEAFCHYVKVHYELLAPVKESKTRLDQSLQEYEHSES